MFYRSKINIGFDSNWSKDRNTMMLLLLLPFILYFTLKTEFLAPRSDSLSLEVNHRLSVYPTKQTVLMSLATNTRTTNVRHFVTT